GCAQCHDHKFDPFSQREYYQLFAFLNNADEPTLELATPEQLQQRRRVRDRLAELEKQSKTLDTYTPAKEEFWERNLSQEQRQKLPARIQTIIEIPVNGRTPRQAQMLTAAYRQLDL